MDKQSVQDHVVRHASVLLNIIHEESTIKKIQLYPLTGSLYGLDPYNARRIKLISAIEDLSFDLYNIINRPSKNDDFGWIAMSGFSSVSMGYMSKTEAQPAYLVEIEYCIRHMYYSPEIFHRIETLTDFWTKNKLGGDVCASDIRVF